MKALKVIAIIALIVGLVWIGYLTLFDFLKEKVPQNTGDEKEEKEIEQEVEDPDYVPNKILDVTLEEDVEKEKKSVKINVPLDPFGRSIEALDNSNFRSEDPDEFPGGVDASVKQNGTWISNAREEYKYKTITGTEVQTELGYYLTRLDDSYQPIESIKVVTESGDSFAVTPKSSALDREKISTLVDRISSYRKKMYYYKTGKFQKLEYIFMPDTTTASLSDEIITGEKVIQLIKDAIPNFYSEQKAYLTSINKQTKRIEDPILKISVDNGSQGESFDLTDDLHPADIYQKGVDKEANYRFAKDYYDKGGTKTLYFKIVE